MGIVRIGTYRNLQGLVTIVSCGSQLLGDGRHSMLMFKFS